MKQPEPKMYFVYLEVSVAHSYGERHARRGISPQMKERKPKTCFVYFKASIVNSWGG